MPPDYMPPPDDEARAVYNAFFEFPEGSPAAAEIEAYHKHISAIGKLEHRQVLALAELLGDARPKRRVYAAWDLVRWTEKARLNLPPYIRAQMTEAITGCLNAPDPEAQLWLSSLMALGGGVLVEAIPILIEMLTAKDKRYRARASAIYAAFETAL